MKQEYTIGLDIGTTSVGYAAIDSNYQLLQKGEKLALGVRLFEAGESAASKRLSRNARRRRRRQVRRLTYFLQLMDEVIDDSFFQQCTGTSKDQFFKRKVKELPNGKTDIQYDFFNMTLSSVLQHPHFNPKGYSTSRRSLSGKDDLFLPTIYHLRQKLLTGEDVGLPLFLLGIYNILKYRGHFIFSASNSKEADEEKQDIDYLIKGIEELLGYRGLVEDKDRETLALNLSKDIHKLCTQDNLGLKQKKTEIKTLAGKAYAAYSASQSDMFSDTEGFNEKILKTLCETLISLIHDKEIKAMQLFGDVFSSEDKLSLDAESFEKFTADAPEEIRSILEHINNYYLKYILKKILGDSKTETEAKVKQYEQFGKDIKSLKTCAFKLDNCLGIKVAPYIFNLTSEQLATYKKDTTKDQHVLSNIKESVLFSTFLKTKHTQDIPKYIKGIEDLYKKLGVIEEDLSVFESIRMRAEDGKFLKSIVSKENTSIPNFILEWELEQILEVQQKYYPFLLQEDEKWGKTVQEKIISLLTFHIDYFVGPLIKKHQEDTSFDTSVDMDEDEHDTRLRTGNYSYSWLERNEAYKDEAIRPWNYEHVVNQLTTAEKFIKRMTTSCTYIPTRKALPKHSFYLNLYNILNELHGLGYISKDTKRRNLRLSFEQKQMMLVQLFLKTKNITHKRFKEMYRQLKNGVIYDIEELFGTQQENKFASSFGIYITIDQKDNYRISKSIMEATTEAECIERLKENVHLSYYEKIIEAATIFENNGTDSLYRQKLNELCDALEHETNEPMSPEVRRYFETLQLTGYGRLSKMLLLDTRFSLASKSVLEHMLELHSVFQHVYRNEDFEIEKGIEAYNQTQRIETSTKITNEDIQKLAGSPALKRGIWQAVKVLEDLVSIFGIPRAIYLESTRSDEDKKRTMSRTTKADKFIKQFKKDIVHPQIEMELKKKEGNKKEFYSSEKGWLYLLQGGKCLYSGTPLEIENLSQYEVDHIIPQSLLKDDSIDNKALVLSKYNQEKGDKTVLERIDVRRNDIQRYWKHLLDIGTVSQAKYYRLMKESYTEGDKRGFINRQFVETSQIIKHVQTLLRNRFEKEDVNVNLLRSAFTTNTRKILDLPKNRNISHKHHAVDAFLVAVNGQYLKHEFNVQDISTSIRDVSVVKHLLGEHQKNTTYKTPYYFYQLAHDTTREVIHPTTGEKHTLPGYIRYIANEENDYNVSYKVGKERESGRFWKETLDQSKVGRLPASYASTNTYKRKINPRIEMNTGAIGYFVNEKGKVDSFNIYKYSLERYGHLSEQQCIEESYKDQEKKDVQIKGIRIMPLNQLVQYTEDPLLHQQRVRLASASEQKNVTKLHLSSKMIQLLHLFEKDQHTVKTLEYIYTLLKNSGYIKDETQMGRLDVQKETLKKFLYDVKICFKDGMDYYFEKILSSEKKNEFFEEVHCLDEMTTQEELYKLMREEINELLKLPLGARNKKYGRISKKIDPTKFLIVHQSPTGIYERFESIISE